MSKDAYYFTHDCNARNDPKILALRSIYGAEGYGWYFMILEMFREQEDHQLPLNEYTYAILSLQLHGKKSKIEKFLTDCCEKFHLFEKNSDFFFSSSFKHRMLIVDEKREKARISASKRWGGDMRTQCDGNAMAERTLCDGNARKETKGKESKVKETIEPPVAPLTTTATAESLKDNAPEGSNLFKLYESEIGALTPMIAEKLKDAQKRYPAEWFKFAFQEAVNHNARKWAYIETILENWKINGFKPPRGVDTNVRTNVNQKPAGPSREEIERRKLAAYAKLDEQRRAAQDKDDGKTDTGCIRPLGTDTGRGKTDS